MDVFSIYGKSCPIFDSAVYKNITYSTNYLQLSYTKQIYLVQPSQIQMPNDKYLRNFFQTAKALIFSTFSSFTWSQPRMVEVKRPDPELDTVHKHLLGGGPDAKKGPLKFLTLVRGPWKNYHKFSSKKFSLHDFLRGWLIIFMAKRGPLKFFEVWRGGGAKKILR